MQARRALHEERKSREDSVWASRPSWSERFYSPVQTNSSISSSYFFASSRLRGKKIPESVRHSRDRFPLHVELDPNTAPICSVRDDNAFNERSKHIEKKAGHAPRRPIRSFARGAGEVPIFGFRAVVAGPACGQCRGHCSSLALSFIIFVWPIPLFWIVLLAGLILAAWLCEQHARGATICVAGALVCSGVVAGQLAAYQFPANHIGLFAADERHLACVELEFTETPRVIEGVGYRQLPARQVGSATVVALKTRSGWEKASGTVVFSMTQAEPRLLAGQRIRVVGMLERPAPPMNPGEFDWERYYPHHAVLAAIRVNHPYDVQVISPGTAPALAAARVGVRDWLALGFSGEQQPDRAFLQALMLGDRGPEVRDAERDFQKTGTSHLLASSGVRMGVLAAIVYFACRLMRLRPRIGGDDHGGFSLSRGDLSPCRRPRARAPGNHRRDTGTWDCPDAEPSTRFRFCSLPRWLFCS